MCSQASKHWKLCLSLCPSHAEGTLGYSVHLFGTGFAKEAVEIINEYEKHGEYVGAVWSNKVDANLMPISCGEPCIDSSTPKTFQLLALNYLCGGEFTGSQTVLLAEKSARPTGEPCTRAKACAHQKFSPCRADVLNHQQK